MRMHNVCSLTTLVLASLLLGMCAVSLAQPLPAEPQKTPETVTAQIGGMQNLKVYQLLNRDGIPAPVLYPDGRWPEGIVKVEALLATNELKVTGIEKAIEQLSRHIFEIDQQIKPQAFPEKTAGDAVSVVRVIPLRHISAERLCMMFANNIQGLKDFMPAGITGIHEQSDARSIFVTARSEKDIDQLMQIVQLLDRPTKKMVMEVMLLDLTEDDARRIQESFVGQPDKAITLNADPAVQSQRCFYLYTSVLDALKPLGPVPGNVLSRTRGEVLSGSSTAILIKGNSPYRGIWFSDVKVHPDDSITFTYQPIYQDKEAVQAAAALMLDTGVISGEIRNPGQVVRLKPGNSLIIGTVPEGKPQIDKPASVPWIFITPQLVSAELQTGIAVRKIELQYISPDQLVDKNGAAFPVLWPDGRWPEGITSVVGLVGLNALLVRGTDEAIDKVAARIREVDKPVKQVAISGLLFNMDMKSAAELGCVKKADGSWTVPAPSTDLNTKVAALAANNKARLIQAPRHIVNDGASVTVPFGKDVNCTVQLNNMQILPDNLVSFQLGLAMAMKSWKKAFPRINEDQQMHIKDGETAVAAVLTSEEDDTITLLLLQPSILRRQEKASGGTTTLPPLF